MDLRFLHLSSCSHYPMFQCWFFVLSLSLFAPPLYGSLSLFLSLSHVLAISHLFHPRSLFLSFFIRIPFHSMFGVPGFLVCLHPSLSIWNFSEFHLLLIASSKFVV